MLSLVIITLDMNGLERKTTTLLLEVSITCMIISAALRYSLKKEFSKVTGWIFKHQYISKAKIKPAPKSSAGVSET